MSEREGLHKLRHGSFIPKSLWLNSNADERHRLLVQDVVRAVGPGAVVSHQSAAVLLGLPIPAELDLKLVCLTWPGARGRGQTANVRPRRAKIEPEDLITVDDIRLTSAARTVYDLARSEDQLVSVSVADASLREGHCAADDFAPVLERAAGRRGSVVAWQVMTFADSRAATDLHSKVRVTFARLGLPTPELTPDGFEFAEMQTVVLVSDARQTSPWDRSAQKWRGAGWEVCWVSRADLTAPAQVYRRLTAAFAAAGHRRWPRRPPILVGAPQSMWIYRPPIQN